MHPTRRAVLIAGASIALAPPASATPAMLAAAIRGVVGVGNLQKGRVTFEMPPLVENGNAVPLTVNVESPMTEADHVTAIYVFNEKNPQPHVISVVLGARAGKARLSTRIKLADAQRVVGIAALSDGSFWMGEADVIVTIAACVEDVN
ncbi:MAG: SoxY-related AACIE arm protein [Alphaproteobacteria bacterium]|nr:SoxY-related AACIE arm protein [Alphaproteobacteria bacterium]